MSRVLILGAGFGGVAAAHTIQANAGPDIEVLIIDRRASFAVGFRKSWGLLNPAHYHEGQRSLEGLNSEVVTFRRATVETINPAEKAVVIDGKRIEADAIVIALGASHNTSSVEGFEAHVRNVYDVDQLAETHAALAAFRRGRIAIGIFGDPYTCPPAPYEIAYLLNEFFEARKLKVELEVFTPKPMSLPILGEAGCSVIEDRLAERGIRFLTNRRVTAVEEGKIRFTTEVRAYDLMLGIPPHQAPELLDGTGLVEDGWVRPNPETLETAYEDVYAIGDLTWIPMANGKPLPKAGVFAQGQAETVAARIMARLAGREPEATFSGQGGCFLEIGGGQAIKVEGDFLAQPAPQVSITEPSEALLEAKREFERERLAAWFGG